MEEYLKCKSVDKSIDELVNIMKDVKIDDKKIELVKNKYILKLIPPGTKGVIRGNKFNLIVKNFIGRLNLEQDKYEINFEKMCPNILTNEIPDWYIINKLNGKIIIAMNQLDLWKGGQQTNRGSKYLLDCKINTENTKLLCVICSEIQIKSKNKIYNFFEVGFKNDTLCYLNNLENIIKKFLD